MSAENATIVGWTSSGTDRGSIDILWSCCLTIILCCWVSVFPNVPSEHDKWYSPHVDKLNLACIGFLGPDFLFGIALGQFATARRTLKIFRENPELLNGQEWTLKHSFFVEMGGFVLKAPDYPDGFPINGQQFFYLVKFDYIELPTISTKDIKAINKVETFSRAIVVWEVIWFTITEVGRAAAGLPTTTLELTALSFAGVMVATSILWYHKPAVSRATNVFLKDGLTVDYVRYEARRTAHPGLPETYHRTPLDFISRQHFHANTHWSYYKRLSEIFHLPVFGRQITRIPWDKFPSDEWLPSDETLLVEMLSSVLLVGFSISFSIGWNFYFPTLAERSIWRMCSVFHAIASVAGGAYYMWGIRDLRRQQHATRQRGALTNLADLERELESQTMGTRDESDCGIRTGSKSGSWGSRIQVGGRIARWLRSWRNISADQDPDLEIPLRLNLVVFVMCVLYGFCRVFFYVEDFIGLRRQPAGVYQTVNEFIPFAGSLNQ